MIKHTCLAYLLAYKWIHKIKTACFLPTSDAIQHIYNIPHGTNSVESQNHFFHLKTWNVFPLCKIAPSRLVMFFFHYCLNLTPKVIVINFIFLLRHGFFSGFGDRILLNTRSLPNHTLNQCLILQCDILWLNIKGL